VELEWAGRVATDAPTDGVFTGCGASIFWRGGVLVQLTVPSHLQLFISHHLQGLQQAIKIATEKSEVAAPNRKILPKQEFTRRRAFFII
jgi:hypothetical protein